MREIGPRELAALLSSESPPAVLDVREDWEHATAALSEASHIPMAAVPGRLAELDRSRTWVVLCHHGNRSAQVAMYLERNGFQDVCNLVGGIDAWSQEIDPSLPRY